MSEAGAEQFPADGTNGAAEEGGDVNRSPARRRMLSERQENFCQAYIVAGNATRAAINAGYAPETARQQASRLLTKVYILERIADLRRDLGLRNRIDRDTIMAKLEAAYRGAMTGHMYLTAVRAAVAQARLAGLFPDRPAPRARAPGKRPPANGAAASKGNGHGVSAALVPGGARR